MDYYSMTDKGIQAEIGSRIKSVRLRKNMTQQQLSKATALSLNTIKSLESGKGKLISLIAVLRELGVLDALDSFIPEISISPVQLARLQGKKRRRASGKRGKGGSKESTEW
jgi:putative transcriptional regulator